jgi:hypothetical protein
MSQPITQGDHHDATFLQELNILPRLHRYEINEEAEQALRRTIELSICNGQEDIRAQLFPPAKQRKLSET